MVVNVQEARGTVRARRPHSEGIRRTAFRERVLESLWFLPAVMAGVAFALALVALEIDRSVEEELPGWFPAGDVASAFGLTTLIATATLTFMATLFTTTLIAIQLAGGQYSPRVVRVFTHSRFTHVTLGLFLSAFLVAMTALVSLRSSEADPFVPGVTIGLAFVLLLLTIAAFVVFLHRMTQLLRVQYLMREVVRRGSMSLQEEFPEESNYLDAGEPQPTPDAVVVRGLRTGAAGVIQAIDHGVLVDAARDDGAWIELLVETGEYIGAQTPVARVHGGSEKTLLAAASRAFLLGPERTFSGDPGFALRLLVDVAVRSLSPAVNDPTTAGQALDRVTDLLAQVADRPDPTGWFVDDATQVRLFAPAPGQARMLTLAYTEIIRYGADSPQTVRLLRRSFDRLEPLLTGPAAGRLAELRHLLRDAVAEAMPASFADASGVADPRGLG